VSQRGQSSGRFTFTAQEAGDHRICFTTSSSSGRSGWLSSSGPNGGIKLRLDLAIGDSNQIESSDKGKLQDIASRVKDLNARLNDIRREQVFQRVRHHSPSRALHALLTCITGARGRVPRPVRDDQRSRYSLDHHPAHRHRHHLRMAALPPALLLHQAEAHLNHESVI